MKDKSYYNGSDSYFTDLISSNKEIFSTRNAEYKKHAGYRSFKNLKTILHDSILTLKEYLTNYDIQFYISTIHKFESYEPMSYFVYFPENDLIIKIFTEASTEDVNINYCKIEKHMNKYYAKLTLNKINNPKWPVSEYAKKYTEAFYNAVNGAK